MRRTLQERSVGITVSLPISIVMAIDDVASGQMGGRSAFIGAALAKFLVEYKRTDGAGKKYTIDALLPSNHPAYYILAAQQVVGARGDEPGQDGE